MEKGKYKNVDRNNEFFTIEDFLVGKDVKVNSYSFKILEYDEFTRKWLVENLPESVNENQSHGSNAGVKSIYDKY